MLKKPIKVFISGPMSGLPNYNTEAFNDMEEKLKEAGFSVFNPAWLLVDENWTHEQIMKIDISALSQCDAIIMLPGWNTSKGATEEYNYAYLHRIISFLNIDDLILFSKGRLADGNTAL